jgi:restriction endonuclease Mrr
MTVPDYQSVMLPLLKALGDGDEHSLHEVIETLMKRGVSFFPAEDRPSSTTESPGPELI